MAITSKQCVIWYAPTAKRRYMSKSAAINAETRAIIKARHPNESPEYENGLCIYGGFNWEMLNRSQVLYRRLRRIVRAAVISEAMNG